MGFSAPIRQAYPLLLGTCSCKARPADDAREPNAQPVPTHLGGTGRRFVTSRGVFARAADLGEKRIRTGDATR